MRTLQQLLKVVVPDIQRDGEPDSTPQAVPSADPVPELEHILLRNPELRDGLCVRAKRNKVLRDVRLVPGAGEEPLPRALGVGDRLLGGERLARDDEQGTLRIAFTERLSDVRAINVGHEVRGEIALGVLLQRLGDHDGSQIRTTDTDVDESIDGLAGITLPLPIPDRLRELLDVGQHPADLIGTRLLDLEIIVEVTQGNM